MHVFIGIVFVEKIWKRKRKLKSPSSNSNSGVINPLVKAVFPDFFICFGDIELQHINLQRKKTTQNLKKPELASVLYLQALIFTEGEHFAFGCARMYLSCSH